ncbi:MAG TPA: trypsin-like serine protease [Tepidisphaeraceae bacterium]
MSTTFGGTIRDDRLDQRYRDMGSQYAAEGEVQFSDSQGSFLASGTLVGDRWILTAAHVVDAGTDVSSMRVTIGGQTYTADAWRPHPGWNGDLGRGNDIGLIHLSIAVPDIAPATLYTGKKETGKLGTFAGFGTTGTGDTGWKQGTGGTLRAGQNRVDDKGSRFGYSKNILLSDFDAPRRGGILGFLPSPFEALNVLGSRNPSDFEYSIAPGDSGGGMFIVPKKKQPAQLAGVNSFGGSLLPPFGDSSSDSSYGDYFGVTRVSPYVGWIQSEMALGDGFTTAVPLNTSNEGQKSGKHIIFPFLLAVPEPGSALIFVLAACVMGRRRRRLKAPAALLKHSNAFM